MAEQRFNKSYERWRAVIKDAKEMLSDAWSTGLLHEHITKVRVAAANLNTIYEELRHIDIPDPETRRKMDICETVTKKIINSATSYLNTETDEDSEIETQDQKEGDEDTVFKSAASDTTCVSRHTKAKSTKSSVNSRSNSKVTSRSSSQCSSHRQEAAAEAALKVLLEKERQVKELRRLEAENAERQRVLEAENAERQGMLEAKRREVERLEIVKKFLEAAKARLKVYEQYECSDDEIDQLLHHNIPLKVKKEIKIESNLSQHKPLPQVMTVQEKEDSTAALVRIFAYSPSMQVVFQYLNQQHFVVIHSYFKTGRFHFRHSLTGRTYQVKKYYITCGSM